MFTTSLILLSCTYFTFKLLRVLYRIAFHHLSYYPGPKLAVASRWYEVYYQVFMGGAFSDQGSSCIVSTAPSSGSVPMSSTSMTPGTMTPSSSSTQNSTSESTLWTTSNTPPAMSSISSDAMASSLSFSQANVSSLETLIRENIDELCGQLTSAKRSGKPINVSLLYRCFTADIITSYSFSRNFGFLDNPDATKPFFSAFFDGFKSLFLMRESKIIERLTFWPTLLPEWCLPPKGSKMGNLLRVFQEIRNDTYRAAGKHPKEREQRTIFTELPRNEKPPPNEKTDDIIFSNAVMLVSVGLETTGHILETATVHLNMPENAHVLKRLRGELSTSWPDTSADIPSWKTLETLPYLQAVIKESLRLALGVSSRLSMINHDEPMQYKS